jgi:ABC-type transport system substrate-binding protein
MVLNRITVAQLVQFIYEGGWPGLAFGMDYGTEPSLDGLRPFFLHSCLWMSPWHCDEHMVPLIEAARSEFDLERRRALVRQIVRDHHAAPPGIMLWELPRFDALGANVRGYRTNLAFVPIEDVSLLSE